MEMKQKEFLFMSNPYKFYIRGCQPGKSSLTMDMGHVYDRYTKYYIQHTTMQSHLCCVSCYKITYSSSMLSSAQHLCKMNDIDRFGFGLIQN